MTQIDRLRVTHGLTDEMKKVLTEWREALVPQGHWRGAKVLVPWSQADCEQHPEAVRGTARALTGHVTVKMTEHHSHVNVEEKRAAQAHRGQGGKTGHEIERISWSCVVGIAGIEPAASTV